MTCYICQVGALLKVEDILEWNLGLVLTYATILFQGNRIRCVLMSGSFTVSFPADGMYAKVISLSLHDTDRKVQDRRYIPARQRNRARTLQSPAAVPCK